MATDTNLVPALEKSIAEVTTRKQFETPLESLRGRVEAIVVRTQADYVSACELVKEGRSFIKDVGFKLDPGISSAKDHLDFLKGEKERYVSPAKAIVAIAERKAEDWKAEERRKAAAEEERINAQRRAEAARLAEEQRRKDEAAAAEAKKLRDAQIEEARKAGEIGKREANRLAKQAEDDRLAAEALARKQAQEAAAAVENVKVKAAVPTVAGIRARVNWKFRIIDPSKVKRAYVKPDEVAIGSEVRQLKDKAKAEELIGGIEVYCEDSI